VAPPSDENANFVMRLKEQSILKKLKTASKSPYKWQHNACSKYAPPPGTHNAPDLERDQKKTKTRSKSIVPWRTMHTYRI